MAKRNSFASDDDLRVAIRKMLARESQAAVAVQLGISQPALSQFPDGSRSNACDNLLKRMGYLPKRFYQKAI